ncbi:MAG TPA: hypothetical protein VFO10_28435 [Oligoflexus sp.]|uniref:hypothetical protein n=1 Tax=Oligoflexus sp. TaxID=1971216 RepID=UPI002D801605|nr:hypothetical protein [Oligoflexus sp.]HET9241226.1 hypothetical protein [Oligoflexus sp.]
MIRFFSVLIVSVCTMSSFSAAAHPYSAQREFFYLKRSAEFFNYLENKTYVEVVGTSFIGLQAAFNDRRTCLYGLNQEGLEGPGAFRVQTQFVCFNTGTFQLTMKKEWCEIGSKGCEIDPGGISVGIGNLDFLEPTELGGEVPLPKPGSFYNSYPKFLNVDVYKPLRFSLDDGVGLE